MPYEMPKDSLSFYSTLYLNDINDEDIPDGSIVYVESSQEIYCKTRERTYIILADYKQLGGNAQLERVIENSPKNIITGICKYCGAPLNPKFKHCEYCGVYYKI